VNKRARYARRIIRDHRWAIRKAGVITYLNGYHHHRLETKEYGVVSTPWSCAHCKSPRQITQFPGPTRGGY
jgi:hypothetical protein